MGTPVLTNSTGVFVLILEMAEPMINKVAESGILSLDLENFLPSEPIVVFDLKDHLFMGLILKEKDFRETLKTMDLSKYQDKIVALTCSADAIIPMWAYMLVASLLEPVAKDIFYGDEASARDNYLVNAINKLDIQPYTDKRVVIKGCGEQPIPEAAYMEITKKLRPVAKSIMYGEPCSTVPVFKKPIVR